MDPSDLEKGGQLNTSIGYPSPDHPSDHFSIAYKVFMKYAPIRGKEIELIEPQMSSQFDAWKGENWSAEKGCNAIHDEYNMFHTQQGVGEWWMAKFSAPMYVTNVKILNRDADAGCAQRLAKSKVMIGDQYFGVLPDITQKG